MVGGVAGNFVVVGNLWIYGHCAYSAPWVVGFGKPVGLLCGLVVGLHSQYGGKISRKDYKTLYSDKGGSRGYKKRNGCLPTTNLN